MKKINAVLLLVGLLVSTGASAEDGKVTIMGARSCGTWINYRQEKGMPETVVKNWIVGYLSGFSTASGENILSDIDDESIYLWVDNYCKANPLEYVNTAGKKLVIELMKRKGQ